MRDDTRASINQLAVMASIPCQCDKQGSVRTDFARYSALAPSVGRSRPRTDNGWHRLAVGAHNERDTLLHRTPRYFPNLGAVPLSGTCCRRSSYYQAQSCALPGGCHGYHHTAHSPHRIGDTGRRRLLRSRTLVLSLQQSQNHTCAVAEELLGRPLSQRLLSAR